MFSGHNIVYSPGKSIRTSFCIFYGTHLTDCKEHFCGLKYFKCPGHYCIPWRYKCDTVWHCPFGRDERNCQRKSCPGMFRCSSSIHSVICLALEDICNNYSDCHLTNDDEHLCKPCIPNCPNNCHCLGYVIHCRNITSKLDHNKCSFPYNLVSVKESDLSKFDTGFHLEECEDKRCPIGTFKCPDLYCVKLRYLCDGYWDCQQGYDETNCTRLSYPGFYKCKSSAIFLVLENICDDIPDCPLVDDELFCDLSHIECNINCDCLLYAISCTDFSDLFWPNFSRKLPYIFMAFKDEP